jgi:hypothetical protein
LPLESIVVKVRCEPSDFDQYSGTSRDKFESNLLCQRLMLPDRKPDSHG